MTNALTAQALAGVAVVTEPLVSGVTVVTGDDGTYSVVLPVGVYAITYRATNFKPAIASISVIDGGTATKNVALAPVEPVVVTTGSTGVAAPDNTVELTATATALDGSEIRSVAWTQKSGTPVVITPALGTPLNVGRAAVDLPHLPAFKDEYFRVVRDERHALLDRYMVMGITPYDLEEASKVVLTARVETTKGSYDEDFVIHVELPFAWSTGVRNVPVGLPALLHGKAKAAGAIYSWTLTPPNGSGVRELVDASSQNPHFTPDIPGKYTVREGANTLEIYAGTWVGAIDPDGEPADLCTICHNTEFNIAPDKFTPWAKSGHAEILKQNLNAGGHYSTACFPCHSVGYDLRASNRGFDDAAGYAEFVAAFFPNGGSPPADPNNWATMLADYPAVARLANVQCESCHGPNESLAHTTKTAPAANPRTSMASEVCGTCHGEPARHGRFQQWQESGHANYELAIDEATVESRGATAGHCGRCHSAQGFLVWHQQADLTQLIQGANGNATVAELTALGLTKDNVHPQTCATCHDPHMQGTTSGEPNTATVRVTGDTKPLPAGFTAKGVGRGALCITCHNTRNGAHNDRVGVPRNFTAPHVAAQGDVLMGQNAYFVDIGNRSPHSFIPDTCTTCHMELTPPPVEWSFSGSGTNHSFRASLEICGQCHGVFDGGSLQENVEAELEELAEDMGAYLTAKIGAAGTVFLRDYTPHSVGDKTYDLKSAPAMVAAANIVSATPTEPHGQQGFTIQFATPVDFTYSPPGEAPHTLSLTRADVQLGDVTTDGTAALVAAADPLVRSGWNYFLVHGDGSGGVHNPEFVFEVLEAAKAALEAAPEP